MKKIGVLYISTGKYTIFWEGFFQSAECFLLTSKDYEKHYFVFTDSESIQFEENSRVHKIYQEPLPWPYITLNRFQILNKVRSLLKEMDYIYFFNGNMLFVNKVGEEILPEVKKPLVLVKHPGFFNASRNEFTYEDNEKSTSFIPFDKGRYYFMGGLSGGTSEAYLEMVAILEKQVEIDTNNGIIAVWHDESHLNQYAIDNESKIKILDPTYGYAEDWDLPFEPKIMIRDKNKYGGHDYLRNESRFYKKYRSLCWVTKYKQHAYRKIRTFLGW